MKKGIHFAVEPSNAGFTDQLLQFSTLYKFGLSLGYTYWHIPFASPRSDNPDFGSQNHGLLDKLRKLRPFRQSVTDQAPQFNVYDFLGFDDYFLAKNEQVGMDKAQVLEFKFGRTSADQRHINSLEELQKLVDAAISRKTKPGKTVVVKFSFLKKHRLYALINSNLTDYPDGLDLRALYFDKRRYDEWPAIYPEGQVKSMVHIRQGDTAVLPTPWHTYISLWREQHGFKEYAQISDMPMSEKVILVEDYFHFYKNFVSYFADSLSTLLFSDGYERALHILDKKIDKLNFSAEQVQSLRNAVSSLNEREFKQFEEIENCQLLIGEETEKLRHLIHSFLTADLVIIGRQQRMMLKLAPLYCNVQNMPVIIVLSNAPVQADEQHKGLNLGERAKKVIFVDINEPDMENITRHVHALLWDPADNA